MNDAIQITIFGQTKTLKFPNVKQTLDIESMKSILSNGQYSAMAKSTTRQSAFAMDLLDGLATFSVLIPEFAEGEDISLMNMSYVKGAQIVKAYQEYFAWYRKARDHYEREAGLLLDEKQELEKQNEDLAKEESDTRNVNPEPE